MLEAKTYIEEKTIAEQVNERLREWRMNKAELATKLNYSRSAVSQYLNGKYNSDSTALEEKLIEFMRTYDKTFVIPPEYKVQVINGGEVLRSKTQYLESRDYVGVISVCSLCQETMGLGIVVGRSGFGKTHTLKKYAQLPRTIYIVCNEVMNCKDFVRRIENGCGLPKGQGSIDERMDHIKNFFQTNSGYLLIVDEADKLISKYTQKKMEMLRDISDFSEEGILGLLVAGELRLESDLKNFDERLANRMSFYYRLKGLSREEVVSYLEGYDMEDNVLDELVIRANNSHTGCFRLLDRTLNNIIRILKSTGETRITMKVIREASNMMML